MIKVKEITLRYGLFDVVRDDYVVNCVVVRKDNVLYFHTDVADDDFYQIYETVNGGDEWKCGVNRFQRIIERLSKMDSGEEPKDEVPANGRGDFTVERSDVEEAYDIRYSAPCGDGAYAKLTDLREIVAKFCDPAETPDAVSSL
jgi:hypothetical protein